MDCFKNFVTKFINEATKEIDVTDYLDPFLANALYYICRLETNKGPQTLKKYEEYLEGKGIKTTNTSTTTQKTPTEMIRIFGEKEGQRYSLLGDTAFVKKYFPDFGGKTMGDLFEKILRPWHEANAEAEDPNAKYAKMFWDWYNDKKAGGKSTPNHEMLVWIDNTDEETVEKAFGKYYKFAMSKLEEYLDVDVLTTEDKLIQKFWDWHRAKKDGKPYQLDQDTINGLITFLRTPKAVEVLQQYYYYFVRVIEKLADTVIKTPINTTGLQKELQRIMDNLDNDKFVDELEKIEINRLKGGDMTAGPVFVLPTSVIKSIRTMAKDTKNIDREKVGKVDKSQVKECYVYCTNELNRKFHIGRTGIFDLNIQDFYNTYKIVFTRGFNTKTLHKIFDEVCQYLLDQLDKGTAEYWKNRGKIDVDDVEDFKEAYRLKQMNLIKEDSNFENYKDRVFSYLHSNTRYSYKELQHLISVNTNTIYKGYKEEQSPDETALDILDSLNESKDFKEAYKLLKDNGYTILEDTEDDVLAHGPSHFDIGRINQGRKPSWAKKITELEPRPRRPRRSQDWTERAMDSVRGVKKPYSESDWRKDMESQKKLNQEIANELKKRITFDYREIEADKNEVSIYVGKNLVFRITGEGMSYFVKRSNISNVMDRKSYRAKNMKDLIEWIEGQI